MTDLTEVSEFTAGVFQLETDTPALGGPGGPANAQAQALANRTKWLNDNKTNSADLASTDAGKGAALVALEQGGTVQDAVDWLTPQMFNAVPGQDATAEIRAMFNALQDGQGIDFQGEVWLISDDGLGDADALWTLSTHGNRIRQAGTGKSQNSVGAYFKLTGDISKHILKIESDDAVRSSGHVIEGLTFSGLKDDLVNRWAVAGACVYHKNGDINTLRGLKFAYIAGTTLKTDRAVKCEFDDINVQTCGATGYPAVDINGTTNTEATQGCTFLGIRIESTVGAIGLNVGEFARANKFFGGTFESSGNVLYTGDFPNVYVEGYNNDFFGFTHGSNIGLGVSSYKVHDLGAANRWFGGHSIVSDRATGVEMYFAGTRTEVAGIRFLGESESVACEAIRTDAASSHIQISDINTFQCNAGTFAGSYHQIDGVMVRSATGTAFTLSALYSTAKAVEIVGQVSTAVPISVVSGQDSHADITVFAPNASSTATAAVALSGTRSGGNMNIDGNCTALGQNRVENGILISAADTQVKGKIRRVGEQAVVYSNVQPGNLDLELVQDWGMSAADSFAAIEKTGTVVRSAAASIELGAVRDTTVSQLNWLTVSDNAGATGPSLLNFYAFAKSAPGLTTTITVDASNNVSQGV